MASLIKNAHPSPRGWIHPRTGELLKAQKMSQEQINEWWQAQGSPLHHIPEPAPAPVPQTLTEAPSVERELTTEEVEHHYGQTEEHVEEEE